MMIVFLLLSAAVHSAWGFIFLRGMPDGVIRVDAPGIVFDNVTVTESLLQTNLEGYTFEKSPVYSESIPEIRVTDSGIVSVTLCHREDMAEYARSI